MSTSPAVVRFQWPARRWAVTGRCWKGAADGRATWGCHGDCGARHWRRRVVSAIVEPGCRSGRRRARFAARCAGSCAAGCAGAGCAWAAHAAGNRAVAGILGQWAGRRGAGETRSAGNGPAALADSPARTAVAARALSQPDRLASVSRESLTIQRRVLDLAVDQVSGVWLASGMRQRGGVFCGAQKKGSGWSAPVSTDRVVRIQM